MDKGQYGMLLGVALVAGLVGGIGTSWVLTSHLVFAESGPLPTKVLQAERFEVVDQAGQTRAALAVAANGALGLTLADQAGKTRAILGTLSEVPHTWGLSTGRGKPTLSWGRCPMEVWPWHYWTRMGGPSGKRHPVTNSQVGKLFGVRQRRGDYLGNAIETGREGGEHYFGCSG